MPKYTPEQAARIEAVVQTLKSAANEPKGELIRILNCLPSKKDQRRLGSIIGRLEAWQNS